MTLWYDADENVIVESGEGEYLTVTDDGYRLAIDEMRPNKLQELRDTVESAIDANGGDL